jgi:hypothetical protein
MGAVAIFHPVFHLLHRPVARVVADVRRPSQQTAQLDVFIRAKGVRFLDTPGHVIRGLAIFTNTGFPVITAHVTSPGPAHNRHFQFLQRRQHISAKAFFIRKRRARLEDTSVNLTIKMLQESAKNHRAIRLRQFPRINDHGGMGSGGPGESAGRGKNSTDRWNEDGAGDPQFKTDCVL